MNTLRCLQIGDATMSSMSSRTEKIFPLHVQRREFKGSPSDYASLTGVNDQNLDTPNVFESEFVTNEPGDKLYIEFEGYVLNNVLFPDTHDEELRSSMQTFITLYRDKGGLDYQAKAILSNILNCRFLRRNNQIFQCQRKITFTTHSLENRFELPDWEELPSFAYFENHSPKATKECIEFLASRLYESNVDRWFKISAELYTGKGLTVFPAQEMRTDPSNRNKPKNTKDEQLPVKNKKPYKHGRTFLKGVNEDTGKRDVPLIDQRHIGYALFTYDIWYKAIEDCAPININPAGFSEKPGTHYRDFQKGNCFYNYHQKIDNLIKELREVKSPKVIPGYIHYLVACYIKGGVFKG
ncbi:type I-F CRISPR-associated protein Cas7f/Csy3 [Sansalvadorimonas verongulae]|uniref:type I-F CRISPR-associated protein Cas7f/Csy3 n=1 Tax=Sansalvadorimonas verongulae TaxID=2172824 RepID=UPI0012BC471D|nr:type I-F CRISPR-associated protein Cas7f/Csy3 [Sansalvadorimonas verongulae]MTI11873.1 type I-F CRISPR-associated protein Cas7f/Csy3 [Sansalvadorimonas verongulae]